MSRSGSRLRRLAPAAGSSLHGAVTAVTTYQPGTGGLPAAGSVFGHAAR
ncbi:hypothetical protein [Streptomyces sp. NRRL B-24085]|nr:hypothetical protein [Streptomyces sp. NRRL B-24085]